MSENDEVGSDELLEKIAAEQLKADYRKSLGKEHSRRYLDIEIKKIFRKDKEDGQSKTDDA